jgi:hypothetical protein
LGQDNRQRQYDRQTHRSLCRLQDCAETPRLLSAVQWVRLPAVWLEMKWAQQRLAQSDAWEKEGQEGL